VNLDSSPVVIAGVAGSISALAMLGRRVIAARMARAQDRERRETIVAAIREATQYVPAGGGAVIIVCTSATPTEAVAATDGWPAELSSCLNR
jgi:hypothetical protein